MASEVGSPVVYAIKRWQVCPHQLHVRNSSKHDAIFFFFFSPVIPKRGTQAELFLGRGGGVAAGEGVVGVASEVMHHARARDGSDEHIIQRASLLTELIYFDNQFTIVPVAAWVGELGGGGRKRAR